MRISSFLLFTLAFYVHSSLQQSNRNQQQISALSYGAGDFPPLPQNTQTTTATTSTSAPETTTKKKGFFSGFTGLFKSKDKDKVDDATSTTTTTTTAKSIKVTPTTTTIKSTLNNVVTTPKLPARSESPNPPTRPPTSVQQTSTMSSKKSTKDDFPTLPTVKPTANNQPPTPAVPNAWGKPATPTPAAPNAWGTPPTQQPNAWGKPLSLPTPNPQTTSTTTKKSTQTTPSVVGQTSSRVGDSNNEKGLVTDAELLTLSDELFSKDINNQFKNVVVNYQGRTQSSSTADEASQPLLKVDDKVYKIATVEKMKSLFNNYELDAMVNEYVSPIERKEEDEFIDALLATPVMKHAMNFLQHKGVVTIDQKTHREFLRTIWFGLYSRGMGKIGSSGFEHVFVSETKNGTVLGLHNWIYLSEVEKKGDLNYKGWMKKIDLGNKGQIAKVRFALNDVEKPSNSLFIGTSPELEMAVYSICFGLRADNECRLAYGGKDFNIVTHTWRYRGKNLIGSAYPEI